MFTFTGFVVRNYFLRLDWPEQEKDQTGGGQQVPLHVQRGTIVPERLKKKKSLYEVFKIRQPWEKCLYF